jgi:hypothetical protein
MRLCLVLRLQHLEVMIRDIWWFLRFALGCKKRMGQDVRPDLAMLIGVYQ